MDTITIAIIAIIVLIVILVLWFKAFWLPKTGSNKEVSSPSTKSGYPYLIDKFHFVSGGGEIVGGKLQNREVISLDVQTGEGVHRHDYNLKYLDIENKAAHLLGIGQEQWIFKPQKLEMMTPITDGEDIVFVKNYMEIERKQLQEELDRIKTENEQLKSNPELVVDEAVTRAERMAKASKPPMQKRPS